MTYYDITVNFLVEADTPDDAEAILRKAIAEAHDISDWEIDFPIEENTQWEVSPPVQGLDS